MNEIETIPAYDNISISRLMNEWLSSFYWRQDLITLSELAKNSRLLPSINFQCQLHLRRYHQNRAEMMLARIVVLLGFIQVTWKVMNHHFIFYKHISHWLFSYILILISEICLQGIHGLSLGSSVRDRRESSWSSQYKFLALQLLHYSWPASRKWLHSSSVTKIR